MGTGNMEYISFGKNTTNSRGAQTRLQQMDFIFIGAEFAT